MMPMCTHAHACTRTHTHARARARTHTHAHTRQLVDELLAIWSLEDYEDTLEELEEVLIVSALRDTWQPH